MLKPKINCQKTNIRKTNINIFFILTILILTISSCKTINKTTENIDPCITRRAAIDMGSGSTRLKIADINTCENKIHNVIFTLEEKIDFKESLQKESLQKDLNAEKAEQALFNKDIEEKGLEALTKFKNEIKKHNVADSQVVGVATAAFREASNGQIIANIYSQKTNIPLKIISQKEEAILGFYSAISNIPTASSTVVIWDIGGGSQQITTFDERKKEFIVYTSDLASISFKDYVIENIQKKHLSKKTTTPNPINAKEAQRAIMAVFNMAKLKFPKELFKKLHQTNTVIYGIGGVHGYSIKSQTEKSKYTLDDIMTTLNKKIDKNDSEIGGAYASTEVTNLILVAGYMKSLNIAQVEALKINNTDGLLLYGTP